MPKPISVILHDNKIIASFACRDEAVREFKKIEIVEGEISLHILDRPDRKKRSRKVVQAEPSPEKPVAKKAPEKIL